MANSPAEALTGLLESFSTGDIAAVDALLSTRHPVLFIGTDPAEWWDDRARLLEVFAAQVKEMGFPKFDAGAITSGQAGDVGWAAAQPVIRVTDGPEFPTRFTTVSCLEDGGWKLVQAHLSVGAANEQTVGSELTV